MIMIWNLWGTSFFRTLSSCDFEILPIVEKCDLGFSPLSSFRVGKDNEKIIIIFGFWSVESHQEMGDFLEWYLLFHEPLTVPWLILLKLLALNFLVISDNEGFFSDFIWVSAIFVTEIFKVFRGFVSTSWQARPKKNQL